MLKNKKIIAIQGDDISTINVKTDTTLMLALEAQKRGYSIYWYKVSDLIFINGNVFANTKIVKFNDNKKKFYKVIGSKYFCLSNAKYILMRQNPPFNMDYITGTFFLSCLNMKTKVINNPNAVRNVSEKFYSAQFHKFMPDTIFTKDIKIITEFLKKNKKIVLKPIHGYSGKNILFLKKMNLKKVVKYLRQHSHVMVQKFLPSIRKILLKAIKFGGTTLKDYISTDGTLGNFQKNFKVYNRAGKKIKNHEIIRIILVYKIGYVRYGAVNI